MEWKQAANSNGPVADFAEVTKQNIRGEGQRVLETTTTSSSSSGVASGGTGSEVSTNGEQTCGSIENKTDSKLKKAKKLATKPKRICSLIEFEHPEHGKKGGIFVRL